MVMDDFPDPDNIASCRLLKIRAGLTRSNGGTGGDERAERNRNAVNIFRQIRVGVQGPSSNGTLIDE